MLAQRLARKTDKPNPFVLAWKVVSQRQLWIWVESTGLARNGENGKREHHVPQGTEGRECMWLWDWDCSSGLWCGWASWLTQSQFPERQHCTLPQL